MKILTTILLTTLATTATAGGYTKATPNPWSPTVNVNNTKNSYHNMNTYNNDSTNHRTYNTTKNHTTNNTTNNTTHNIDRSINQDQNQNQSQDQEQRVSNVGNSSHETDYDDYPVSSAIAVAGSLVSCPDVSPAGAVQTRNFGFSFGVNNKDDDCAKMRLCQSMVTTFPNSPRIDALCQDMIMSMDIMQELEQKLGKDRNHYLLIPAVRPSSLVDIPLTKEEKTAAFIESLETK